jgi:hypothetical protein
VKSHKSNEAKKFQDEYWPGSSASGVLDIMMRMLLSTPY